MKTLFTLTLSIFWLFSFSQELELDFAHRYGQISDDLEHSVNFTEYYDEFNVWVVAGTFESSVNVGINSNAILTSVDEERMSFVAIYNQDFDLLNHFKLEGGVVSAAYTENEIILTGGFRDIVDFDLDDDDNELFESQSNFGNGYLASFSHQGNLNWAQIFTSEISGNRGLYCSVYDQKIILCSSYDGSTLGGSLFFNNGKEVIEINSGEFGGSVILFEYSIQGGYQFHHQFYNEIELVSTYDFKIKNNKIYISFGAREGQINIGINEEILTEFSFGSSSIICAYSLNGYGLLEYYAFDSQSEDSASGSLLFSLTDSNDMLVSIGLSNTVSYSNHLTENPIEIANSMTSGSAVVALIDLSDGNIRHTNFQNDEFLIIQECLQLLNGDILLSVLYEGELQRDGEILENLLEQDDKTSSLFYLNNELNGIRLYNIQSNLQSEMTGDILLNPTPDNIVFAGRYDGNHDVDFSSSIVTLGNVSDDRAGFIVSYNFDPTTEISEQQEKQALLIYPNPTSKNIFLSEKFKENTNIKIYSSNGQLMDSFLVNQSDQINVMDLKNGKYTMIVNDRNVYHFVISH